MKWRILCYHAVFPHQVTSFQNQLRALREEGWSFCGFSEALNVIRAGGQGNYLTLTFDDGDHTIFDVVLPIISNENISACVFVTTDYVLKGHTYRDETPLKSLTWDQLKEWLNNGHEVGSHSHTHAPLSRCHPERVKQEMALSKRILEENLGSSVVHFSYPWGQHNGNTKRLARQLGLFGTAATIDRGDTGMRPDCLELKRDVVEPDWGIERMKAMFRQGRIPMFYRIQRLLRRPRGYWDLHPEEKWLPLKPKEDLRG